MPAPSQTTRNLPVWLVVVVILLLVSASGWGLWRYFESSAPASAGSAAELTDANVDGPNVPRGFGGRRGGNNFNQFAARIAANVPDGVMTAGRAYLVKAGNARVDIDYFTPVGGTADWRFRFSYVLSDIASPDQVAILRTWRRVVTDPAAAEKAGVTQDQIAKLRNVGAAGMIVDASDRTRIALLFHAWLLASGRSTTTAPTTVPTQQVASPAGKSAEQELVAALAETAKRELEPTRQAYASRVQQIHAVLGDALLQKLKPAG